MIPTRMLHNVRAFAVAGVLALGLPIAGAPIVGLPFACAADPGAQPLEPTSKSQAALPQALGSVDAAPESSRDEAMTETSSDAPRAAAPPAATGTTAPAAPNDASTAEPAPFELPRGTTVLHVGDSFAGALGPDLNRELSERGVRGVLKQEKATYIPTWASRKELSVYLKEYKPDLILVTLGGNELGIVRPEERAETVQRLVKRFEGTPCVWIGIPLWKDANPALLEVIRNNVSPCRYLDSSALVPDLERAKDKIHPSLSARKIWASAVVRWLAQQRLPNADKPWALK